MGHMPACEDGGIVGDGGEKSEEKHRGSQEGNGDEEQVAAAGRGVLRGRRYPSLDHLQKEPHFELCFNRGESLGNFP